MANTPVVYVRAERASNGPQGLCWPHDGAVIAIRDVDLAHSVLAIDGYSEASPPPAEPVTEPDPDATADDEGEKTAASGRRGRGKAITEQRT
jgi:hypothetical protein